jgi:hypothetical protein
VIKDALREQEQKYREQLEAKERQIRQQKEIMGRQQQMLMKSTQLSAPPQDVIDIRDVQGSKNWTSRIGTTSLNSL